MRLFRFLADFRYFQGKFHHFCKSSKSGLNFFFGGGEGVRRRSLDAISTTQEVFTIGIFDWELLYSTEIPLSTFLIRLAAVK